MDPVVNSFFSSYNRGRRFQDWKEGFDKGARDAFEDLVAGRHTRSSSSEAADAVQKDLQKIALEVEQVEEIVKVYEGIHRTSIYYNVLDTEVKLLIRLDRIDVGSYPQFHSERLVLLKRLPKLVQELEKKIHKDDFGGCKLCIQRSILT